MPALHYTKPWEAEFPNNETVTYECLDGYRLGSTVYEPPRFLCSAERMDSSQRLELAGQSLAESRSPCPMPYFPIVPTTFRSMRSAFCDLGYSTSGLASGLLSFHSALQKDGAFVTPSFCRAVSCGTPVENHGNVAPGRSATLATKGYTTCQGDTSVGSGQPCSGNSCCAGCERSSEKSFLCGDAEAT